MDVMGKGKVKSTDNCRFRDNSSVSIVGGDVNLIVVGESVSRSEFGVRENVPDNIKVL